MERNVKQQDITLNDIFEVINTQILNKDRVVDLTKLQKYVKKNLRIENAAAEVYAYISKGLLKHAEYPADVVLRVYDNLREDLISRKQVCEDMLHLTADVPEVQQLVKEYFGKADE